MKQEVMHNNAIERQDEPTRAIVAATPATMLQAAIDRGADPQHLGALTDLYERWQAAAARKAFNEAMTACQTEMPVVVKDRENSHTRSRYASLEEVQKGIKATYTKHGFTLSFAEGKSDRDGWVRVVGTLRHSEGHVETFYRDGPVDNVGSGGKATKTELHGVASTVTYLTRHLLCGIFSVTVANMDDDGNAGQVAYITGAQADELRGYIANAGKTDSGFLGHYQFDSFEVIPAARFNELLNVVKSAARKAGGNA